MGLSILKGWVISGVAPHVEQLGVGQQGQGDGMEVMAGTEKAKRVSLLSLGLLLPLVFQPEASRAVHGVRLS